MPLIDFFAFDLEIGLGDGYTYPVAVLNSPAGEARVEIAWPFSESELANWLNDLETARFADDDQDAAALAREFGVQLFDALMVGDIRSRYDVSIQLARAEGAGLRLKLRINALELVMLPWELLYDSRTQEFVALSHHTPIVRYLEVGQPVQQLQVEPPLRILGMVASPGGVEPLDVEAERARIEDAIAPLVAERKIELAWLEDPTWRGLQTAMQKGPWYIFHFIGHAQFDEEQDEGAIVVADDNGQAMDLSAHNLARLLGDQRTLRLVTLNACEGARGDEGSLFSSIAATLVARGLPAVLAMQYEISDDAAIEFSHSFYGALANGYPIDAATGEARKALSLALPGSLEWATPALFMRAADGSLWEIEEIGMDDQNGGKWWDELAGVQANINTGQTGGDVITAVIGAGSRNIAVGKNITQQVYGVLGEPTPDDETVIKQQFDQLKQQLAALQSDLDAATLIRAEGRIEQLEDELSDTDEDATPRAKSIIKAGDWLLDNIPDIAAALTSLFATPAVGRVVGKAGEAAVEWVKARLG